MTQEELDALCDEWQKRLRLQDWHVVVRLRRHYEMNENTTGVIDPVLTRKEARIDLLCEEDRLPIEQPFADSVEHTLVHELLHLHFEPFWDDNKRVEMEQAIQIIADALVPLKMSHPRHIEGCPEKTFSM